jgi:hypothetical protein
LASTSGSTITLQFLSSPQDTNEGKRLVSQKVVSTDTSGTATFVFSPEKAVGVGHTVTATATKNATVDTSEFSASKKVVAL